MDERTRRIKRLITELFEKENIELHIDSIKVWYVLTMAVPDVIKGINYVKNTLGKNIIVYQNIVPHKERLSSENDIKIYDRSDITELAMKHKFYEILDHV